MKIVSSESLSSIYGGSADDYSEKEMRVEKWLSNQLEFINSLPISSDAKWHLYSSFESAAWYILNN